MLLPSRVRTQLPGDVSSGGNLTERARRLVLDVGDVFGYKRKNPLRVRQAGVGSGGVVPPSANASLIVSSVGSRIKLHVATVLRSIAKD